MKLWFLKEGKIVLLARVPLSHHLAHIPHVCVSEWNWKDMVLFIWTLPYFLILVHINSFLLMTKLSWLNFLNPRLHILYWLQQTVRTNKLSFLESHCLPACLLCSVVRSHSPVWDQLPTGKISFSDERNISKDLKDLHLNFRTF